MYKIFMGLLLVGCSSVAICLSFEPVQQVTETDASQAWLTGQPASTIAPPAWGGTLRSLVGYPLLIVGFASTIWGTVQLVNQSEKEEFVQATEVNSNVRVSRPIEREVPIAQPKNNISSEAAEELLAKEDAEEEGTSDEKGGDRREEFSPAAIVFPSTQKYRTLQDFADSRIQSEQEDWLEDFIFETGDDGIKKFRHANFKIDGINGSGKSTLGERIMAIVAEGKPIERYLINPKHVVSKPDWGFEPFCASIKEACEAIERCKDIVQERIQDPAFDDRASPHQFFVIDEHDWIFQEYGAKYISPLRSIFKVCRALNGHVLICGQSPNAGETGLSGADFSNMGRIVMGITAIQFFKNPQFPYEGSLKEELYKKAVSFQKAKKRFALVIPSTGLPSIRLIPHITRTQQQSGTSSKVVNFSRR